MKALNIIVCNDLRCRDFDEVLQAAKKEQASRTSIQAHAREKVNFDGPLCKLLRDDGHNVTLFDGHGGKDLKTHITETAKLSNEIASLIIEKSATCMVLDLNFFGDFQAGIEIMRNLRRDQSLPSEMKDRILIYSRYTNEPAYNYEKVLTKELKICSENILNRNTVKINTVAAIIKKWSEK